MPPPIWPAPTTRTCSNTLRQPNLGQADNIFVLMISADLLKEARRRAGISPQQLGRRRRAGSTQAAVGRRVKRSQPQIARWDRGDVKPSLETLRELIRACGLEL